MAGDVLDHLFKHGWIDLVQPFLNVRDPKVAFRQDGETTHAVRGVSFDVKEGETVALVGAIWSVTALSSRCSAIVRRCPGHCIQRS